MSKAKSPSMIKFQNPSQVVDYAAQHNKVLVVYDDYILDVTTFAAHHPGGAGLILNYQTKDVSQHMKGHHSLTLRMADSLVIGSYQKDIEKYIDPKLPLVNQIWDMDHKTYMHIVDSPHWLFEPSPRMFESDFFQSLSHNQWYKILFLPALAIGNFIYTTDISYDISLIGLILSFVIGVFTFSLIEYLLHRFIFHSQKWLPDDKLVRYLHYILHGIHHMLPNDPDRLVFPPVLFIIFYTILTQFFYQICPIPEQYSNYFICGVIIGYLIYDLTHYSLHHVDTSKHKGSYFHKLQKYHNRHHFGGEQAGFGVSSKFWDIIFRTEFSKDKKDHKEV